jgi:hypothetical protein
MNIRTSYEGKRGCGYRKAGGLYLVTAGEGRYCGALPIPLGVCPTCHAGIKPARGWTWINLQAIRAGKPCIQTVGPDYCNTCPFFTIEKAGLIWVGEKFYPQPTSFSQEAAAMGISRRIAQIPREFKIGDTWVALAHRKAIATLEGTSQDGDSFAYKPGIFYLFRPTAIEYVVKESDTEEKLEAMEKRGISLVKVIPQEEKQAA